MPLPAVPLDSLSEQQLEAIEKARKIYTEAGGVLDEYELPFLVRHLVPHKWRAEKAQKSLKTTAEWRQSSGANRQCAMPRPPAELPREDGLQKRHNCEPRLLQLPPVVE